MKKALWKTILSTLALLTLSVNLILTACSPSAPPVGTSSTSTVPPTPATTVEETDSLSLKCMTFNLRYDTASHPAMATSVRGEHLMEVLDRYAPDSIGFCEATDDWMNYLRSAMGERGYAYVGVGRDRGKDSPSLKGTGNEHTPVFYNTKRFKLIEGDTFWLSDTPDIAGSTDWNSACKRVCSYAVLEDRQTGARYAHFATHLDHVSEEAQHNGVRVIQSYIRTVQEKYDGIGIVLSGDFNVVAYDKTNPDYRPTTYNFTTSFTDDSRTIAKEIGVDGSTWSGYQNPDDWEKGHASQNDRPQVDTETSPIDYIFFSKGSADVHYYTVVDDTFTFDFNGKTWSNHPISDHYGLYVSCDLFTGRTTAPDESACIDVPAELSKIETLPAPTDEHPELITNATLTASNCTTADQLKEDGTNTSLQHVKAKDHLYWEIVVDLKGSTDLTALSFRTSGSGSALSAECFIGDKMSQWKRVGASVGDPITGNVSYAWTLGQPTSARYAKFTFSGCTIDFALERLSVLGSPLGSDGSVVLTPVSGPKPGQKEGFEKIIDGDESTKFYINTANDALSPLIFRASEPVAPTGYSLTTADDNEKYTDRLVKGWTLYGSMDGESWTPIAVVTEPAMESKNFTTYEYTVDTPTPCLYFRIDFELASSGKTQFSEFCLRTEGSDS